MNLRRFCELIFQHCPLLAPFQTSAALSYAEFLAYKTRVPVRGAILLNAEMTEVVLVKGWNKKAKWSFPRGKINKEERDLDCAVREVYEETGYDVKAAGLVDANEDNVKYIDMALREQQMRLYVFRDVPMDTHFEPKTRKEISRIDWFKVAELAATGKNHNANQQQQGGQYGPVSQDALKASQFYMVAPFIRPLRQWIKQQRKLDQQAGGKRMQKVPLAEESEAEVPAVAMQNQMVYDDGMMTTDPEDNTHFQQLISGLYGGGQAAPRQEAPPAASIEDLSSQLKMMLSVGGPVAPPAQHPHQHPHAHPQGNPLMNALFNKSQGQMPPQTPLEQIASTPPQAQTPHHHHPRPPQFSEMPPPPSFPISPPHGQPQYHEPMPPHWQGQLPPPQAFQGQLPQMPPPHMHNHQVPAPLNRGLFGTNIPLPPAPPTARFNPLHQIGEPSFRPGFDQSSPQQMMQRPAPLQTQQLDPHKLNLLNAFTSPRNADARSVVQEQPQPSPRHLPELAEESKPILPSQLLGGVPQQRQEEREIHAPLAQRSRNAHQDSLLSLFKSAATPAAQTSLPPPAASDAPAELAAQPSPLIPRETTASGSQSGAKISMRRHLPNVHTNDLPQPSGQSPNLTSATVSGPLNAPDFETAKKRRPVEIGGGAMSPSPLGGGRMESSTPPVPVHTVREGLGMEAPRPFHPTSILKRGEREVLEMVSQAAVKPAAPPPQPKQGAFDRRDSSSLQQKNALLNLFGGGTAAPAPPQKSPAEFPGSLPMATQNGQRGSPVSPLPSHLTGRNAQHTHTHPHQHNPAQETTRSSRISSINSVPGDLPFPPTSAPAPAQNTQTDTLVNLFKGGPMSAGAMGTGRANPSPPVKRGSVAGDGSGTGTGGATSPITPVEKSFLLGMLRGVVDQEGVKGKGAGQKQRQGSLR